MLIHTRKGTTIVTQQEKVTNETRQQMNNLFQRLCSVRSFCCRESIFSYLRRAVFILSQANFYSIHFLKVRHFPGKIDNKPLPGVFLEAALPLQQTFKKVLRPIFIWRGTGREFVACLSISWQFQWVFQKLCHLLAIFLDCSRSPCPLISKPTLSKTILSSSFVWESRTKTDKLFFSSLEAFTSKIQGNTVSTIFVEHDSVKLRDQVGSMEFD